jgi:TonB family protein
MAAFHLPVGEISPPLKDEQGYHVIVVDEKNEKTYAEARREVEGRLKAELTNRAEEQLQMAARVVLDPEYFGTPKPADGAPDNSASDPADGASRAVRGSVPPFMLKDRHFPHRTNMDGVLQTYKLLRYVPAVYPPEAIAAGISGHVTLFVLIGKDGTLLEVRPSTGDPQLIQAATEAVSQWAWRPTLVNGLEFEVTTRVDFEFALPK